MVSLRREINLALCLFLIFVFLYQLSGCNKANLTMIDNLVSRYDAAIQKEKIEEAYDYLSAMIRVAPDSKIVFERAVAFVEKTRNHSSESVAFFNETVLSRVELLIPFQSPDQISGARQSFNTLIEQSVSHDGPSVTFEDSIILDDVTVLKQRCDSWRDRADVLVQKVMGVSRDASDLAELGNQILQHLREGEGLARDAVMLQVTLSGNSEVDNIKGAIEKQADKLLRSREWVYNLWAYTELRKIEDDIKAGDDRVRVNQLLLRVAVIEEQRLQPWFAEVYYDLWKKLFEKLKTDEDKITASKARLLKFMPVVLQK